MERLAKHADDPATSLGYFDRGQVLVTIDRGDYWQCGFVIRKGGYDEIRTRGLDALHADLVALAPFLADRVAELQTWEQVSLLTVRVDRLRRWYRPRLLCIGDAAHAMSPIGGVGINLAVQDAIAAANILAEPLRSRTLTVRHLAAVERRRRFPTVATQLLQTAMQRVVFRDGAGPRGAAEPRTAPAPLPFPLLLLQRFPALRAIPARVVGVGIRPEHIRTPEIR